MYLLGVRRKRHSFSTTRDVSEEVLLLWKQNKWGEFLGLCKGFEKDPLYLAEAGNTAEYVWAQLDPEQDAKFKRIKNLYKLFSIDLSQTIRYD